MRGPSQALDAEVAEVLVKLVAPFIARIWADELWREALGREGFVLRRSRGRNSTPIRPSADEVELAVQICGKIKGRDDRGRRRPGSPRCSAAGPRGRGRRPRGQGPSRRKSYVPGRLVNIVAV